jgi:hypothetical protein
VVLTLFSSRIMRDFYEHQRFMAAVIEAIALA